MRPSSFVTSRCGASNLDFHVHRSNLDHVPQEELAFLAGVDAGAIDERAVGAAVVEQPHSLLAVDEDRVPPRDRRLVEAQVCMQAATDPCEPGIQ